MNAYQRCMKVLLVMLITVSGTGYSATEQINPIVEPIQQQWAEAYYSLTGKPQSQAFDQLMKMADQAVAEHPESAELLVWRGIVKSSYAGVKGGLSALKYVHSSKEDLEHAMAINDSVMDGSAYTSLGILYLKVPGWPISFGDDEKSQELLLKALAINPEGIDSNYFYAEWLKEDGRYEEAKYFAEKALHAAPRKGRELADSGRRQEVRDLLSKIEKVLN